MKTQIIQLEPYDDIYSAKDKMGWGADRAHFARMARSGARAQAPAGFDFTQTS